MHHQLVGYHRPATVSDAVALLGDGRGRPVGGGTTIRHGGGGSPIELVDLQALGLATVEQEGDRLRIGAMLTLQQLHDHALVPDLVRGVARAEQPSTLRTLATVGGTIGAADPESVVLAALLVYEAVVRFADDREAQLSAVLSDGLAPGDLILSVSIVRAGRGTFAATGRTPADVPIVAAVGRAAYRGPAIALTGVGSVPMMVDPAGIDQLEPPADFRGTSEYRRHLASVLTARVVRELS